MHGAGGSDTSTASRPRIRRMFRRWSMLCATAVALALPGCKRRDDAGYKDLSLADLLKRNNTPEIQARICDMLERDAAQRGWLADAFASLESREQMGAIQAVCCVGSRTAYEEFHPIVVAALKDEYMRVYAQECFIDYDFPDRQAVLREQVTREADLGGSIMFLGTYLELYGPADVARVVDARLAGDAHVEHKVEIALALVQYGQGTWQTRGMAELKGLLDPQGKLLRSAPPLVARVFTTVAAIRCKGWDALREAARLVATEGYDPAKQSAQEYLDALQ